MPETSRAGRGPIVVALGLTLVLPPLTCHLIKSREPGPAPDGITKATDANGAKTLEIGRVNEEQLSEGDPVTPLIAVDDSISELEVPKSIDYRDALEVVGILNDALEKNNVTTEQLSLWASSILPDELPEKEHTPGVPSGIDSYTLIDDVTGRITLRIDNRPPQIGGPVANDFDIAVWLPKSPEILSDFSGDTHLTIGLNVDQGGAPQNFSAHSNFNAGKGEWRRLNDLVRSTGRDIPLHFALTANESGTVFRQGNLHLFADEEPGPNGELPVGPKNVLSTQIAPDELGNPALNQLATDLVQLKGSSQDE